MDDPTATAPTVSPEASGGLSGGQIAGIVIGVLVSHSSSYSLSQVQADMGCLNEFPLPYVAILSSQAFSYENSEAEFCE